jgi:hypothetical protein
MYRIHSHVILYPRGEGDGRTSNTGYRLTVSFRLLCTTGVLELLELGLGKYIGESDGCTVSLHSSHVRNII